MRNRIGLRAVVCACVLSVAPSTAQELSKPAGEWSAEFTTANRYVWRGFVDGGRTFEADITYSRGPWEFCTSTEVELSPIGEERMVEVDLGITRRMKLRGNWAAAVGYEYYATPTEEAEHGHEFWTGVEYSGPIDFSLKAYQFAVPHTGNYFSVEAGRKLFRTGRFSLRGDATLGFNRHMSIDTATFSDATFTLTPALQVHHGRVEPFVSYMKGLNKRYFDDHVLFGMKFVLGRGGE